MKIKKLAVCMAALASLIIFVLTTAQADTIEQNKKLSPAFDVIAAGQRVVKTGLIKENVRFTLTDFKQYLGVANISSVTIREIPAPATGFLAVGSMVVSRGQVINGEMLSLLEFVPASGAVDIASFSFSGDESTSGAELKCTVRLIEEVNYAPSTDGVSEKRLNVSALSGKTVSGTLLASDPEGDALYFEIVSYPEHGVITSLDPESGRYVYRTFDGYTGDDSFMYVAVDEFGNYTNALDVSIKVGAGQDIEVSDIADSDDASAVCSLLGTGIMSASVRGGELFFCPDIKVSRAEFIMIAMKAAGKKPCDDLTLLEGISDVSELSGEAREYMCTALKEGFISAEANDRGERFLRPFDTITKAEAARILSKLCGYEKKADEIAVFADSYTVDASTGRCISAMYEYGIIDLDIAGGMIRPHEEIDRETCAVMIYRYMNL